jgi:maleylpyruvate isomerase
VHPVQNLKVLARLRALNLPEKEVSGWARWVIGDGLAACQKLLASAEGPFCFGASPTLADLCLVPQLFNARRFDVDLTRFDRLISVEAACAKLPAFADAAPEKQPDAE